MLIAWSSDGRPFSNTNKRMSLNDHTIQADNQNFKQGYPADDQIVFLICNAGFDVQLA